MKVSEVDDVNSSLAYSRILFYLIGFMFLLLVLSCGPLLPVWMFINALQLIAHVPLIRTNLPGNFNFFILDYLNIIRLHTTSLNVWL